MIEKIYGEHLPTFTENNKEEYDKYLIIKEASKEGFCPCGSGNKYKSCHLNEVEKEKKKRDNLKKLESGEYYQYLCTENKKIIEQSSGEFKRNFKKFVEKPNSSESLWGCIAKSKDNCLNSKCGKKMGSHTIYKSKGLSVFGELLEIDKFQLRTVFVNTDNPTQQPKTYEELKSLGFDTIADKAASKVNILCGNHDVELFRSIEQTFKNTNEDNFIFTGDIKQLNAYSIRVLILEYYAYVLKVKRQQELLKNNINFLFDIAYQKSYSSNIDSITFYIEKLNQYISNQVNLDNGVESNIEIFSFSKILNIKPIFSGCFSCYLEINENEEPLHINILPQNNKTLILMTTDCKSTNDIFLDRIRSFEDKDIIAIVSGLIASFGSNLYFSKSSIESNCNEDLVSFMNEWRKDNPISEYLDLSTVYIKDRCNNISKVLFPSS